MARQALPTLVRVRLGETEQSIEWMQSIEWSRAESLVGKDRTMIQTCRQGRATEEKRRRAVVRQGTATNIAEHAEQSMQRESIFVSFSFSLS